VFLREVMCAQLNWPARIVRAVEKAKGSHPYRLVVDGTAGTLKRFKAN
jgi:hypothetical protein